MHAAGTTIYTAPRLTALGAVATLTLSQMTGSRHDDAAGMGSCSNGNTARSSGTTFEMCVGG